MAWTSGIHHISSSTAIAAAHHHAAPPSFEFLMFFGCVAAASAGVACLYRRRSRGAMLVFSVTLILASVYGFAQGAWPLGVFEACWAIRAVQVALVMKGRKPNRSWVMPRFKPDIQSRQERYWHLSEQN